jgi:hypothetical protein
MSVRRPIRTVSSFRSLIRAHSVVLPSPLILRAVATVTVSGFAPCNSWREKSALALDMSATPSLRFAMGRPYTYKRRVVFQGLLCDSNEFIYILWYVPTHLEAPAIQFVD